ncbi:hypothetical protein K8R33_00120 [archaeon]|nr:hypothetical protein [archaeon]
MELGEKIKFMIMLSIIVIIITPFIYFNIRAENLWRVILFVGIPLLSIIVYYVLKKNSKMKEDIRSIVSSGYLFGFSYLFLGILILTINILDILKKNGAILNPLTLIAIIFLIFGILLVAYSKKLKHI